MKKELILIYGGRSGEHEVSLRSAASVYKHLDREKYNVHLIGISKEGLWYLQDPNQKEAEYLELYCREEQLISLVPMRGFLHGNTLIQPDVILPVTHGTFGEDGTLQGLFEMCGFPYVGSTVGGSYLGMDKEMSKTIWQKYNIDIIPFQAVKKHEYSDANQSRIAKDLEEAFNFPMFVKPSMAGSSVGVSKVDSPEHLHAAMEKAFKFDTKVIVEPAIAGKEVECSVIGNHITRSFPPGEIAPTHDFYDYEAKYIDPDGACLIIPAEIESEQSDKLRAIAENAYKALGLKGYARVDFFITNENKILLNEVNTIPGFTNISMFSMLCDGGGLPYSRMLDTLITLAEEQFEERSSLKFSYD